MLDRKLNSEQCEFEQMTIIANNIIISIAIIIVVTILATLLLHIIFMMSRGVFPYISISLTIPRIPLDSAL